MEKDILLNFEIDTKEAAQSIDKLRAENRKLTQERNKTNISTKEGKQAVQELNKQIDANNKLIKENSNALEKQRLNVGNYTDSITEAGKELKIAGTSVGDLTGKLSAFANPATAAVGIISGLAAAYVSSAAGARDLDSATTQLGQTYKTFSNTLADLLGADGKGGGFLSSLAFQFNRQFFGTASAVSGAIAASAQQQLKELEITGIQAQRAAKIALDESEKLRQLRDNQDKDFNDRLAAARGVQRFIDQREATLIEFQEKRLSQLKLLLSLDENNLDLQKEIVQVEFEIADIQEDSQGKRTEALNGINSLLREQKVLIQQNAAAQKKAADELAKQEELRARRAGGDDVELASLKAGVLPEKDLTDRLQKDLAIKKAYLDKTTQDQIAAYRAQQQAQLDFYDSTRDVALGLSDLFSQGSDARRGFALLGIAADTASAIASLTAASEANPLNSVTYGGAGIGQFASGLVRILANIAAAKQFLSGSFAEGGYTGYGKKYETAGIVHKGEYVVPKHIVENPAYQPVISNLERTRLRGYADGGLVTNTSTAPVNQSMAISNALKNMPIPQVSVKEITTVQDRIRFKESIATR